MSRSARSVLTVALFGLVAALLAGALAACTASPSADTAARNPAPYEEGQSYEPAFDPANFDDPQANPYFPLIPGVTTVFEGGDERVEVTVTHHTRTILGIVATVVTDQVFVDGELVEDTVDWFAADNAGNVWYLGEETAEYENGEVVSTAGTWEAGVDGAQPGIIMLADPQVDDAYRQEFYAGEAEDVALVYELDQAVEVPAGSFADVLVTEEWTPLDPGIHERKWYARDIGVVFEEVVSGGSGTLSLVELIR